MDNRAGATSNSSIGLQRACSLFLSRLSCDGAAELIQVDRSSSPVNGWLGWLGSARLGSARLAGGAFYKFVAIATRNLRPPAEPERAQVAAAALASRFEGLQEPPEARHAFKAVQSATDCGDDEWDGILIVFSVDLLASRRRTRSSRREDLTGALREPPRGC